MTANSLVKLGEIVTMDDIERSDKVDGIRPMEHRLIDAMVAGAGSIREAGELAGYSTRAAASKAWNRPRVRQRFVELVQTLSSTDISLAVRARRELLQSARSEKVRLDAAMHVLDRAGQGVTGPTGLSTSAIQININLD